MAMDGWYRMGRWGPPLPSYTSFQRGRSRGWLLLVLLVALVALCLAWLRPAAVYELDLDRLCAAAEQRAMRRDDDSRLFSIQISTFRDDDLDDTDLRDELEILFSFCSTSSPDWDLYLIFGSAEDDWPSVHFLSSAHPPQDCAAQTLVAPWLSPQEVLERVHQAGVLSRKQLRAGPAMMLLERWPDGRQVWRLYYLGDWTGWLYVDASTGALLDP
ncbi:MAG: hypothetical protein JXA37_03085 [Chloroflexia bacterium]|nr:hypothetical protein [Chloroflexia bacterium]